MRSMRTTENSRGIEELAMKTAGSNMILAIEDSGPVPAGEPIWEAPNLIGSAGM